MLRHLGRMGALDRYRPTKLDVCYDQQGSGEIWRRNVWDERDDRRPEASAVDETPHGLIFEFCEAGGPRRLRYPVLLCFWHLGLWLFNGVGCNDSLAVVGRVLVLSDWLCWPVLGLVNTFFLSMRRDASFAFSRKICGSISQ